MQGGKESSGSVNTILYNATEVALLKLPLSLASDMSRSKNLTIDFTLCRLADLDNHRVNISVNKRTSIQEHLPI